MIWAEECRYLRAITKHIGCIRTIRIRTTIGIGHSNFYLQTIDSNQ